MVDFETRSYRNVKDVGAWRYAEDETTEILCMAYKFDNEKTMLWAPGLPFPQAIINHAATNGLFEAHNVQFERAIWKYVIEPAYGVPVPKKWVDSMAVCAYRGLPLKLEKVGKALNLSIQKDQRGKYLLQTLSVPKWGTKSDPDRIYREDLDLMEELYDYCIQDVDTERQLSKTVGDLPTSEHRLWILDQIINQRGVKIHIEAVNAAIKIVSAVEAGLNEELAALTDNQVTSVTQRDRLLSWLRSRGLTHLDNIKKDTITDFLSPLVNKFIDDVDPDAIRVMRIRQILAKSSVGKLSKMLETVSIFDDRIRGMLQYHGAGTGRWAGRGAQPHNLPRGSLEDYCDRLGLDGPECMELLISTILGAHKNIQDAIGDIEFLFGDVMEAIVTAIRGMFIAEDDKCFMVSDFAAIEAVVLAWLAGETWKLEAFEKINRGEKYEGADDIYCATASKIFQRTISKKENKTERQVGKTCELAFGYQGAIGAWRNFDRSDKYTDEEVDTFKTQWRSRHPATVRLWYGLQEVAIKTVRTGNPHRHGRIVFAIEKDVAGTWLVCILPNGRKIWYYEPVVEEVFKYGKMRDELSYMGRDNKRGGTWGRVRSYGGMLTENVVQAISRDLMAEAMIRVENAGYPIILTVHDEIIAEVLKLFGSLEEFEGLMSIVPPWAEGCPVGVAGEVVTRYMKV
jgi:DNA polymerase